MMFNVGWDTETYLIGAPLNLIPAIVCGSWDMAEEGAASHTEWSGVYSTGDGNDLFESTLNMWQGAYTDDYRIIIQNAPFDITVAMRFCMDVLQGSRPGDRTKANDLYLLIWDVLEKNLDTEWQNHNGGPWRPMVIADTLIREKLKNLSAHGGVDILPWGKGQYSLAALVMHYFKENIFDKKVSLGPGGRYLDKDGNDITGTPQAAAAWRLRYSELDMIPVRQWPREAYDYALSDATWARMVYDEQERKRQPTGPYSMNSEALQIYAGTCLSIATANGFKVDAQQRDRVMDQMSEALQRIEPVLRQNGILRSNGTINQKIVKTRVEQQWDLLGRHPLLTPSGDIATSKEVMEILASFDPYLELYAERQIYAKLRDAFLPKLQGAHVWTNFDILKETGRTSSNAGGKKPIYPAVNSQQIPRKPGVREIFIPGEGWVICSNDYGAIELCSVGQCTYNLFGYSMHRDKINAGYDLHCYLGAALARLKDPEIVDDEISNLDRAYTAFQAHRKAKVDDEDDSPEANHIRDLKRRCQNFRNFAKPVGLGYPGGLSVNTLCVFAKTVYHVIISPQESEEFRALWFQTYPEMEEYFGWVRNQTSRKDVDKEGSPKYFYETPGLRRFRSGATYCATANGASMQSLSADGGKRSVCWLGRACAGGLRGDNPYQILDACRYLTFIHDENLVAIPDDDLVTERSLAIRDMMIQAMDIHMPDVKISAEPALMRRWTKAAEPEWQENHIGMLEALQQCEAQYGMAVASLVEAAGWNTQHRLVPWDDRHQVQKGLQV